MGDGSRPFPGLRPFGYADRDVYFGRTAQIYSLYRMLDRSRFVAVVGSSGSGKSSLVFAGLRPLLEKESTQSGGRRWIWRQMSPKNAPIEGLIDLVYGLACEHQPATERDSAFLAAQRGRIAYLIRLSSNGLVDAFAEIEGLKDKTLVLLVDQFEELFRYAKSSRPQDRARELLQREEAVLFVQLLLAASRDSGSRAHIVLTMRSDFIGDCGSFRGLPEAVSETQFLVPALTRDQLEEVIRKPIEKCGATIDSRLVERLLNDASDEPDQLPVLQHCLLRLWEAAGKPEKSAASGAGLESADEFAPRNVTVAHYNAIGRIAGALSQHADEILSGLAGLEPVVERVFRALSEIDKEGRGTRRTVTFSNLRDETGAQEDHLRKVLDRFRADDCSFLRPIKSDKATLVPDTLIDVGHEALLRHWDKVRGDPEATGEANDKRPIGWLREEAKDGRRYQALLSIADGVSANDDGLPLPQVERTWDWWTKVPRTEAWAKRYGGHYASVRQLLDDGRSALKHDQQRRRRIKWATRGAVIAGCVLLVIIGWYNIQLTKERQATTFALQVTRSLVNTMLGSLNYGEVSTGAASALMATAKAGIDKLEGIEQTSATMSTEIYMALANSDFAATLGDDEKAYQEAIDARNRANKLVALDPGDSDAQELVYQSLFRIADIRVGPGPKHDMQQGLTAY